MRRRPKPDEVDPIAVAAATPDEPLDAQALLTVDGVTCGSWECLAAMQAARREQLPGGLHSVGGSS
ncbi:hypothetical protein AU190_22280 [Mycolicibacterium acapulense]|nr:hypothetical protein AU190_22280 [Mycolicibacterium acapulense]